MLRQELVGGIQSASRSTLDLVDFFHKFSFNVPRGNEPWFELTTFLIRYFGERGVLNDSEVSLMMFLVFGRQLCVLCDPDEEHQQNCSRRPSFLIG